MSIFYENISTYQIAADKVEERKRIKKEAAQVIKNLAQQYPEIDAKDMNIMKDYLYAYKKDWEENPFSADPTAEEQCILAKKFRAIRDAILTVREFGRLDMLQPFIAQLATDGITLSVEPVTGAPTLVDDFATLVRYKTTVKELTDEYTNELRATALEGGLGSSRGFDIAVNNIVRARSGKNGAIDKCSEELSDAAEVSLLDASLLTDCMGYIKDKSC